MALASVSVQTGVQKLLFHFHLPPLTFPTEGMCAECLKSCPTLFNPTDCSPPGSSARGILQARRLEWVAVPSSRGSS